MQKPETIKKVLVAGSLTKPVAFKRTATQPKVMAPDGTLNYAERVNPEDMPKEIPTSIKGVIDLLINERGCEVDIAQTYEEAKVFLQKKNEVNPRWRVYDGVVVGTLLPTTDKAIGKSALSWILLSSEWEKWKDSDLGMQIAGVLLAHELCTEAWGVVLDTVAPRAEDGLWLAASGIRMVEAGLEKAIKKFGWGWNEHNHFKSNWKWINNCDSCAVAALFGEI